MARTLTWRGWALPGLAPPPPLPPSTRPDLEVIFILSLPFLPKDSKELNQNRKKTKNKKLALRVTDQPQLHKEFEDRTGFRRETLEKGTERQRQTGRQTCFISHSSAMIVPNTLPS